jgi:hypothetical protein
MIEIKIPSQQRYSWVDIINVNCSGTYFIFGYDFSNIPKKFRDSVTMPYILKRLTQTLHTLVLQQERIKSVSLETITMHLQASIEAQIDLLLKDSASQKFKNADIQEKYENHLKTQLQLNDHLKLANSVFAIISIDEDNDTFVIHDSFQNGQQMLNFTQTTQGLVHQIDVKRASTSNQGELLISIKYQKEN